MEKRYESDLTPKERRQREYEKIKNLGFKQRIEYFITYYKIVPVMILVAILIIYLVGTMIHNANLVTLLNIALVDASYEPTKTTEELEQTLLEYIGTGDKHERVMVDATASSSEDYTAVMKMTVVMAASETDILVCNKAVRERYQSQEAFLDWKEVLGEEYASYEKYMTDGCLDLSKSEKWKEGGWTIYEPSYACVLASTENLDQIRGFVKYFYGD